MPPAIDHRYRSVIFQGGGIEPVDVVTTPYANPIDFVPLMAAPTLLLHGNWDECSRIETRAEPLRLLLRCKHSHKDYDGGHYCPPEVLVPIVNAWLDETLGAVPMRAAGKGGFRQEL